jgi:TRAP-type C4-dicarboxylate transport system permease large subunit
MAIADVVTGLELPPLGIMAIIIVVFIILGMFMDALAMIIITIPIFLPAIRGMGFDLIWFGVILTITVEMALITPPVGMNVYVLSGVAPHVPLEEIFQGVLIFVIPLILILIILMFFPQIALFLPGLMKH